MKVIRINGCCCWWWWSDLPTGVLPADKPVVAVVGEGHSMCPVSLGSRYWCYPAGRLVTHFFLQSMQMVPVPPGATDVMGHALCGLGVVGVGVGWFCGFVGFEWDLQVSGSNG